MRTDDRSFYAQQSRQINGRPIKLRSCSSCFPSKAAFVTFTWKKIGASLFSFSASSHIRSSSLRSMRENKTQTDGGRNNGHNGKRMRRRHRQRQYPRPCNPAYSRLPVSHPDPGCSSQRAEVNTEHLRQRNSIGKCEIQPDRHR